jgi:hypothetical protein
MDALLEGCFFMTLAQVSHRGTSLPRHSISLSEARKTQIPANVKPLRKIFLM